MGLNTLTDKSYLGWILLKTALFILGSFVFSIVFYHTQKWLDGKKKKRRR